MPPDKPTLTTPLLSFDFAAKLAGRAHELAKKAPAPASAPETPTPPSGTRRRMATKKAVAPAPPPAAPAPRPRWHKVVRNWKSSDEQLDFELRFDEEGDPIVTVFDADHVAGKVLPLQIAVSLETIDEAIGLLQVAKANAIRIRSGQLTPEDTIEEDAPARRVDDPDDDEEEDEP
jgi:hypothetical protein